MKLSKSYSIGLITTLIVCLNFGVIGRVSAKDKSCKGADCNDKDPVEYGCDSDGRVVEQVTQTVYRWQDSWQPQQIIIQQIFSEKCQAKWIKAYVPNDTYLFMRERDTVNSSQSIRGLTKAKGTGYFWTYGSMSNGYVVNQACVALSLLSENAHDLYNRYCTNFN